MKKLLAAGARARRARPPRRRRRRTRSETSRPTTSPRIEIAGERVYVTYVLDLAEIPTFQERGKVDSWARPLTRVPFAAGVRTELALSVDGRRVPLRRLDDVIGFPPGAAGLHTTRLEVLFAAPPLGHAPTQIEYHDGSFAGRLGWQEIVVKARDGATLTRTTPRPPARATSCARTRRTCSATRCMSPRRRSPSTPGRAPASRRRSPTTR